MFTRNMLNENGLLIFERLPVWGNRSLRLRVKVGQLASKCRQLVQWVFKSQTISTPVATFTFIHLGKVFKLTAVQMVDLV